LRGKYGSGAGDLFFPFLEILQHFFCTMSWKVSISDISVSASCLPMVSPWFLHIFLVQDTKSTDATETSEASSAASTASSDASEVGKDLGKDLGSGVLCELRCTARCTKVAQRCCGSLT
jgi:hypothetical protein